MITLAERAQMGITLRLRYVWARLAYARYFDQVSVFCLFAGYARSGHSLIAALLNAHRDAVVAHEANIPRYVLPGCSRDELYAKLLARSWWFNRRRNFSWYSYAVPGQWQGRFANLQVIGDKRAGALTRAWGEHPDLLDRIRALVGVPLRLIHVVRHPLDNIATLARREKRELPDAIEYYFRHVEWNHRLSQAVGPGEWLTTHHERLIQDPRAELSALCAHLGLMVYPGYLENCASVVFKEPRLSRRNVAWTDTAIREVATRSSGYPFLRDYRFDLPATDPTNRAEPALSGATTHP
jgi:hypothetical protein